MAKFDLQTSDICNVKYLP